MIEVAKIGKSDITEILSLLDPYVKENVVLKRSRDEIIVEMNSFFLARIDGKAAGVVSYHDYESNLFEVRSLVVADAYKGAGVGKELVRYVVKTVREKSPFSRIFALTYVPEFFFKLGFEKIEKSYFPEKIWKDCSSCSHEDHCTEIAVIDRGE